MPRGLRRAGRGRRPLSRAARRKAWGGKNALDTRWWSLVIDRQYKVATIRNGSCGDALTKADVPRIIRALTELDLLTDNTMIAVDDGGSVIVGLMKR